jgi:hypothetical protein
MHHSPELIDIFLKLVEIFDGLKKSIYWDTFSRFAPITTCDCVAAALLGNITMQYVRVLTYCETTTPGHNKTTTQKVNTENTHK